MNKTEHKNTSSLILATGLFLGLTALGYQLSGAAIKFKEYERTVTVKGLSEREVPADIVIWPVQFSSADNDLPKLYDTVASSTTTIIQHLSENGIKSNEISFGTPVITDKLAQQYGAQPPAEFRYSALQTITIYSGNVSLVRQLMRSLSELGKKGIVFSGSGHGAMTEYLFTRLNEVKPEMVEEATKKAREVALKFASDSDSRLGKIKNATQGQFSIRARDRNTPHIKNVRVVSTIEYFLSD